ncbi:MAG: capsular polysaccharide biosynthesis protein CapF [Bacteroidales bacterium]|nr:capsular polysaccharide biosynthesis protein CapF [Bacteroidales bacterium]
MKILVTGAKGFVGKNLVAQLRNIATGKARWYDVENPEKLEVLEYDIDSTPEELDSYCREADFVFNLAGVNRPKDQTEFMKGNFGFASTLLDTLKKYGNICPVMISSSIQAELDNPYGESKRAGEQLLFDYAAETGARVLVYRFPNLFGKWCRPNYNSAVATFCNNIAHGLPIQVNNPTVVLHLIYIDDLVDELIGALSGKEHRDGQFCFVPEVHEVSLGRIVELIESFRDSRTTLEVPYLAEGSFEKKLYSTYLSYLPEDAFAYPLTTHVDARGSFTEFIRSAERGQVSVNISKPGITKGQHWHHSKNEKFLVVSGHGVIRFRNMREPQSQVLEYLVDGKKLQVVDTPTGYTHSIVNLGDTDMVTLIWCNECFDPSRPDTYGEEV